MAQPLMQHELKKKTRHIPLPIEIWDEIEDRMRVSKRSYGAEISSMIEQLLNLGKLTSETQARR